MSDAGQRARSRARASAVDWQSARERLQRAQAALDGATELDPDRARALLDERARLLSRPLEKDVPPGEVLDTFTFRIARERYGLETRYVRGLRPVASVTPVPGAPEVLVGLTHARGSVLPVFDLARLFGLAGRGVTDLKWLVVLGAATDDLGILADSADSVEQVRVDELAPPQAIAPGLGGKLVRGVTSRALVVLDGAALLSDERLFIVGTGQGRPEGTDGET